MSLTIFWELKQICGLTLTMLRLLVQVQVSRACKPFVGLCILCCNSRRHSYRRDCNSVECGDTNTNSGRPEQELMNSHIAS
jgi:hypothetical protein